MPYSANPLKRKPVFLQRLQHLEQCLVGRHSTAWCFCPFKFSIPLPKVKHAVTSSVAHVTWNNQPSLLCLINSRFHFSGNSRPSPPSTSAASVDLNVVDWHLHPAFPESPGPTDSSSMVQMKSVQIPLSYRNGGYQNLHPSGLLPGQSLVRAPHPGQSPPSFLSLYSISQWANLQIPISLPSLIRMTRFVVRLDGDIIWKSACHVYAWLPFFCV